MQIPQQLQRTLVALVGGHLRPGVRYRGVQSALGGAGGFGDGDAEVPDFPADSAFDYLKRLQPGRLMLERMEAKAGCLESHEIDEARARVLRNTFRDASVRS